MCKINEVEIFKLQRREKRNRRRQFCFVSLLQFLIIYKKKLPYTKSKHLFIFPSVVYFDCRLLSKN